MHVVISTDKSESLYDAIASYHLGTCQLLLTNVGSESSKQMVWLLQL